MQWTYEGKAIDTIPDEYEGFVYLITNLKTGQKYVGKKLAKFKTTKPPLKGKKNKRRGYKESDWKDYWGSSDRLNADVEALGPENFTREILYLCKGRGEMSYLEAKEQFDRRVLETDEYYNGIINVRVGGSPRQATRVFWVVHAATTLDSLGPLWMRTRFSREGKVAFTLWAPQDGVAELARREQGSLQEELAALRLELESFAVHAHPRKDRP